MVRNVFYEWIFIDSQSHSVLEKINDGYQKKDVPSHVLVSKRCIIVHLLKIKCLSTTNYNRIFDFVSCSHFVLHKLLLTLHHNGKINVGFYHSITTIICKRYTSENHIKC